MMDTISSKIDNYCLRRKKAVNYGKSTGKQQTTIVYVAVGSKALIMASQLISLSLLKVQQTTIVTGKKSSNNGKVN